MIQIWLNKTGFLLFLLIIFVCLPTANSFLYAQSSNQKLRIDYNDNSLTISAKDTNIKKVLSKLGEKTNTYIWNSDAIKKKITIELSDVSLKEALKRLLRDYNHAIIYSGKGKKQAEISEVLILNKKTPKRYRSNNRRITNRKKRYEKQVESMKRQLSRVDSNSRRGKILSRRIRRLEKMINRLER